MSSSKTVLITGCSAGGIGAALALSLANKGHHVYATARDTSKIPGELAHLSNVTILPLDVTDAASVARAAQAVEAAAGGRGGGLDVLVNNAGGGCAGPVLDMDVARAQRLHDVNLWGPVRTVQAFAGLLIAARGRVVNVSSVGAIVHTPWISAYASSKAALTTLSETLRLELSPFGVSVITIMAGVVTTRFHDNDTSGFDLPPGSRYAPVRDIMAGWVSGASVPRGCPAEEFVEGIVDDVLGRGGGGKSWGGLVFRGPHAGAVRFMMRWLPTWCADALLSQNQGLKELAERYAADGNK